MESQKEDGQDAPSAAVYKFPGTDESYAKDVLAKYNLSVGETLGEGSYAKVRRAMFTKDGEKAVSLACKIISRNKAPKDFLEKFLPRELDIVCRLQHSAVIRVQTIFEIGHKIYIFMELAEGGDLLDFIRRNGAMEAELARRMFRQFVAAIKYIHQKDIVHRDLKCENLLLDKDKNIKVTDFGFARYATDKTTGKRILSRTYCGSAAYAAPEILQGTPYNPKMYDVWSMGCILYIMVCGSMPYDDSNIRKMLKTQLERKVGFPSKVRDKVHSDCKVLIHHMLEVDITKRATVVQIDRSSWLSSSPGQGGPGGQEVPSRGPGARRA